MRTPSAAPGRSIATSIPRTTTADVRDAADNRRGRLIRHLGIALLVLVELVTGPAGGVRRLRAARQSTRTAGQHGVDRRRSRAADMTRAT
jgi:hypothetical protein